jgi:hypothetical protein
MFPPEISAWDNDHVISHVGTEACSTNDLIAPDEISPTENDEVISLHPSPPSVNDEVISLL